MDFLRLIRISESIEGTFGVLKLNEIPFCVTLEPPDRQNERSISQIPPSQYYVERHNSPKYGKTWRIVEIHRRSGVLFHAGNVVDHTRGCILTAQYFGKLHGDRAVLNSGNTFREFMRLTESSQRLHLTIVEHL